MAEIKKLTKKEKYGMVLNYIQDNEMLVEFIENEINLLNKKANSSSKTQTQLANEIIKEKIVALLTEIANPITITEFQKYSDEMGAYSNQKLSALFKQLHDSGVIKKFTDKKKTYFYIGEIA